MAFYGVVLDGPGGDIATVTEYMVNGSLRHALQKTDKYFFNSALFVESVLYSYNSSQVLFFYKSKTITAMKYLTLCIFATGHLIDVNA